MLASISPCPQIPQRFSGPYAIAPEGSLVDRLIFKLNSSDGISILELDKTFNPRKLL
jgi:hypothetical protein